MNYYGERRRKPQRRVNIQMYQMLSKWSTQNPYNLQSSLSVLKNALNYPNTRKVALKLMQNTLNHVRSKTREYMKRNTRALSKRLYENNRNNNNNNNNYRRRY